MLHGILNAVKNYVIKAALKADKTTRQKMSINANFQKKSIGMKIQKKVLNSMGTGGQTTNRKYVSMYP